MNKVTFLILESHLDNCIFFVNNAKFMINGDPGQIDLPRKMISGLNEAKNILKNVDGIKIVNLDETDVIRHEVVKKIINAYKTIENDN